jgi:hypothetical protein
VVFGTALNIIPIFAPDYFFDVLTLFVAPIMSRLP